MRLSRHSHVGDCGAEIRRLSNEVAAGRVHSTSHRHAGERRDQSASDSLWARSRRERLVMISLRHRTAERTVRAVTKGGMLLLLPLAVNQKGDKCGRSW